MVSQPFLLRCLVLRSTTKQIRSMGSQFCWFYLKVWEYARPSIAERIWKDQQSADPELSFTSACKIFFIVVLLQRGKIKAKDDL